MFRRKKKKDYIVTLEVNMCADRNITIPVKAVKPAMACKKAVNECYKEGCFYACAISCKEVGV